MSLSLRRNNGTNLGGLMVEGAIGYMHCRFIAFTAYLHYVQCSISKVHPAITSCAGDLQQDSCRLGVP